MQITMPWPCTSFVKMSVNTKPRLNDPLGSVLIYTHAACDATGYISAPPPPQVLDTHLFGTF